MITTLNTSQPEFRSLINKLLNRNLLDDQDLENKVRTIINQVKLQGDQALIAYANRFDQADFKHSDDFTIHAEQMEQSFQNLEPHTQKTLKTAYERIWEYHRRQKVKSWQYQDEHGSTLGQRITPIEKAGIYVPGGKASYPSSILMNSVPAKMAGVSEITMVTPNDKLKINPLIPAAAYLAGVHKIHTIGGAHAIAALAHGTASINKVDKIVGPGNKYVAEAKKQVFGIVGIDMIAGPSERLIIADGSINPDWIAMDMFAQAEHDQDAQAILLCPDQNYITQVHQSIQHLIQQMPRKAIIEASLAQHGALIKVKDMNEACALSNKIAPEHLEIMTRKPEQYLSEIKNAGAIFLGGFSSEALGDYCAGPNHVLPTASTARFASPLGVYDFQKRSSIIQISETGARELASTASELANYENLAAHSQAALMRIL